MINNYIIFLYYLNTKSSYIYAIKYKNHICIKQKLLIIYFSVFK